MKRRFKTVGLLAPWRCDGSRLSDQRQARLAVALKKLGFRETKWQYIFDGQLYGLVLPYQDGRNEVHIRFYEDRIFSEYEIGRSSLAHFLGPFRNANRFIKHILDQEVCDADLQYLARMTDDAKLRDQERDLPVWDFAEEVSSDQVNDRWSLKTFEGGTLVRDVLSWRVLFGLPVVGVAIASGMASVWLAALVGIIGLGAVFHLAPENGRP